MLAKLLPNFDDAPPIPANSLRCRENAAPYWTMANHVVTNLAGSTVIVATVNRALENPEGVAADLADAMNRVCI